MNERKVDIKVANADDVSKIVALNHALFQEDAGQRDPFMNLNWAREHGKGYFSKLLAADRTLCLLAETNDIAVGYLIGYMRGQSNLRPIQLAELESMFVKEPFRGRGIGATLATQFLEWSKEQGAQRVSVTAYAVNKKAIAFYNRLGFESKSLSLEAAIT